MAPSVRHYEGTGQARFLTFSCYRRMDLLGSPAIRDLFAEQLACARERVGFVLNAWVVMPNHVHLIVRPSGSADKVNTILRAVKQPVAQRVTRRWHELGAAVLDSLVDAQGVTRFWQRGGGYDRNIRDADELYEKIEYIHANPVRAGLVDRPTDWAWSSARWWADRDSDEIAMDPLGL